LGAHRVLVSHKAMLMPKIKKLSKVLYWAVVVFVLVVALGTVFSTRGGPGGIRMFVVLSGSMRPAIKEGSVVLVAPQTEYGEGDIVTYLSNSEAELKQSSLVVTHRIVEVNTNETSGNSYLTKGDANEDSDRIGITEAQIVGAVLFTLPWLGHLFVFTKTQLGFTVLIVIPATLLIYNEILNLKAETVKFLERRQEVVKKPVGVRTIAKKQSEKKS